MSRIRENRIDLVRGISLLLIFVDHCNLTFSGLLQHSRGFSDAAELFVTMAGMSAALAYHPAQGPAAPLAIAKRTFKRAFKLYRVHLALLAILAAFVYTLRFPHRQELVAQWALEPLFAPSVQIGIDVVLLRYLPAGLDILPLYVVLVAAIPLFFVAIDRSPWLALAASAALWLAAGLFHLNLTNLAEPKGVWFFNPFSWQLVFVCGLIAGLRLRHGQTPFPFSRPLFVAALVFCLAAIPANLIVHVGKLADSGPLHLLVSKTSEGPLRLINALAIAYVVFNLDILKRLSPDGILRPLFATGRNSLPVFLTGIVLADITTAAVVANASLPLALELTIVALGCAIQLMLATSRDRSARQAFGRWAGSLVVASDPLPDYDEPASANETADIRHAARNTPS
ncbi:OpgC domain-containing protein [Jiella sp. MQZ9-1]|uniref:OpgC domain-containing protein n=1 Tax=Jiella flava TaxID=2816857 RepID=A0A939JXJ8_9HYPH|nr:OpgC domain-containing protein [Jiella flava]MBO0663441.1 OpgC domain-containing protein [Jiella flava]MCD2472017.1 OpgC domain-containing protein [Jiella flava]